MKSCNIQLPSTIELFVNVDGLPISGSNNLQFWPIICRIKQLNLKPIVIGIFCGKEKPGNKMNYTATDEYLQQLISEWKEMFLIGAIVGQETHTVRIIAFVTDIPAGSLIKKTKGHTGRYCCTKCDTPGIIFDDSKIVSFPHWGQMNPFEIKTKKNTIVEYHH